MQRRRVLGGLVDVTGRSVHCSMLRRESAEGRRPTPAIPLEAAPAPPSRKARALVMVDVPHCDGTQPPLAFWLFDGVPGALAIASVLLVPPSG